MIDIDLIRKDQEAVVTNLAKRGVAAQQIDELLDLDAQWRKLTQQLEELNKVKNETNDKISKASPEEKKNIIAQVAATSVQEKQIKEQEKEVRGQREAAWQRLPNLVLDDVPAGKDESENTVIREVGEKPTFDFQPLTHDVLGETLDVLDNERAAKVSGSRFTYLKGGLVFLELALVQYVLSILTNRELLGQIIAKAGLSVSDQPFVPVIPPVLIKEEAMDKMARLEPKEERYYMPEDNLYLVGSAEHTLGSMHMNEVFAEAELPRRYIGFSPAFRREAGSHGKDVKGIIRMHQFDKLEMESFSLPEDSLAEQHFFVAIQEYILQQLGIAYRVMMICTGDMGTPDARQVDIEAWMPGQGQYRETHTADLMTDYQARRLKTRVKRASGEVQPVHMNDATAVAIGRTIIAIMENYQKADGTIALPEVLHSYLPIKTLSI